MAHFHDPPAPPIYSLPRLTTLVASVLVALASGTNYVFSAYGPQLGARLAINHTQLNIVALAGNIGVYSTGPIWGRIVDTRGPRILLACAFGFLLIGYLGMRSMYDTGLQDGQYSVSIFGFLFVAFCCYLTGAGGNAGLASAVNSTAKSFPDQMRATTTGLVISGFGLSAFFFSSIARAFFAGDTSSFLLLLGAGTAIPMVIGFFLVRHIPLPPHEPLHERYSSHDDEDRESDIEDGVGHRTPLLDADDSAKSLNNDVELSPTRSGARSPLVGDGRRPAHERSMSRGTALTYQRPPNVYGLKLWMNFDFYLLFVSLSLLSGTGIMYINNVGTMTQALYSLKRDGTYDPIEAAKLQATQVSTISIMNCLGRIIIGVISDFCKNRYDMPRSYCLILVATVCLISQIVAANINDVGHLWISSSILGLGYGATFSMFPTMCMEWFGLPHFSENWGYLSISPIIAGNIFSIVFGLILDNNEDVQPPEQAFRCGKGVDCYRTAFKVTIGATAASILLTLLASWRDRRKIMQAGRRRSALLKSGAI